MWKWKQIFQAAWAAVIGGVRFLVDVILHLGAHRTGTTMLQNYLENNRDNLNEIATEFWGTNRTRSGLFQGLTKNPADVNETMKKRGNLSCELMRMEMDRLEMAQVKLLIVSEENMIGGMRENLAETRLYPNAKARLEQFSNAFGYRCTQIVLSIRSYDEYWASVLAYSIKRGRKLPDDAMLDRLTNQTRHWRDVIIDIAAAFPNANLQVWPFQKHVGELDHQLALLTGGAMPARMRANRKCRNASPDSGKLRQILLERGETQAAQRLPDNDTRWQPFDRDQVDLLRAQYGKDIEWLRAGADGVATYDVDKFAGTE